MAQDSTLTRERTSLESVQQTLSAATATGRIGEPVNVRLHCETESGSSLTDTAVAAVGLVDSILRFSNPQWRCRSASGELLHVLARDDRGRSALITLCTGNQSTLALTVYGNHGVIRLEDCPVSELTSPEPVDKAMADSLLQAIASASV